MSKPNNLNDYDDNCREKAKVRGDYTFTLVGQDMSSPRTILFWMMENIETAPVEKLEEALGKALLMRRQINRKRAD